MSVGGDFGHSNCAEIIFIFHFYDSWLQAWCHLLCWSVNRLLMLDYLQYYHM